MLKRIVIVQKYFENVLLLNDKHNLNLNYPVSRAARCLAHCAKKDKQAAHYWFKAAKSYLKLHPDSTANFIDLIKLSSYRYCIDKDWESSKHVLDYAEEAIADKESVSYADLLTEYGEYFHSQDFFRGKR